MQIEKGSRAHKRESRPAGTGRLPECLLAGDVGEHTEFLLQAQFIALRYAMPLSRASLIASLAWGDAHG